MRPDSVRRNSIHWRIITGPVSFRYRTCKTTRKTAGILRCPDRADDEQQKWSSPAESEWQPVCKPQCIGNAAATDDAAATDADADELWSGRPAGRNAGYADEPDGPDEPDDTGTSKRIRPHLWPQHIQEQKQTIKLQALNERENGGKKTKGKGKQLTQLPSINQMMETNFMTEENNEKKPRRKNTNLKEIKIKQRERKLLAKSEQTNQDQVNTQNPFAEEIQHVQFDDGKRTKRQNEKKKELKKKMIDELNKIKIENPVKRKQYIWENRLDYPILSQMLMGIKLLYPTSVQCETTFSLMNIVKSPSRNQLGDEKLDDILRIKFASVEDIERVIKEIVDDMKHRK